MGYDLLPQNLRHLQTGAICFLINLNPVGHYWAIRQLSDHLVFKKDMLPAKYLPPGILTREDLGYY